MLANDFNLLRVILLWCLIFLNGCSFSNGKGAEPPKASRVLKQGDVSLGVSTKLDAIYSEEAHRQERAEIEYQLSARYDVKLSEPVKAADTIERLGVLRNIVGLVISHDVLGAVKSLGDLKFKCEDLEVSLIHGYMAYGNDAGFSDIEELLNKISCSNMARSDDVYKAYLLEVHRQFQKKFVDPTLLKYLLHHAHFQKSSMIPLDSSGVSVSINVLYRIWLLCNEYEPDPDPELRELLQTFRCEPPDLTHDQEAKEKAFIKNLQLSEIYSEVVMTDDGHLLLSAPHFPIVETFKFNIAKMIFAYYVKGQAIDSESLSDNVLQVMRIEDNQ